MAYVLKSCTMLAMVVAASVLLQITSCRSQSANDNTLGTNIDNSITFNVPLTVMWRTEDGRTHELTAFRHRHNDEILEEVKSGNLRRVPKLRWVSHGRPVFARLTASQSSSMNDTNAIKRYFRFTPSGFHSYIQMLTEEQKALLARQASKETHLNITAEQILSLPLTKFECSMVFHDENAKKYLIKGAVGDFKLFPLRMDFEAPIGTVERERLVQSKPEHMVFNCRLSIQAQITRTNKLSITSQQLQDIRLADKLFGDAERGGINQIYVTRKQMSELASEVYSTLNIMEDYEISESTFSDAFVDEIVRQLASQQFSQVPIDTVLASISKYSLDFSGDLTADRITSDLGRVLKVEQVGEKSRIVAARSRETSDESANSISGGSSLDVYGSGYGITAGLKASLEYARSNERRSSEAISSLDEQLKELNRLSRNEAVWKIEGDKVIPKSLNVAKLSRTRFGNNITFNRIRRQVSDAAFDYPIKLYLNTDEMSAADQSPSSGNSLWKQLMYQQLHLLDDAIQKINQQQDAISFIRQRISLGIPAGILVQQHYDGTNFFNRTWAEFKVGFGDVAGNYWIGNERLHQLTKDGRYKLRVDLQARYDSQWYWAEYQTFRVGDESTQYRLEIGGYSGTAGDSLGFVSGMKFSTRDRDNDLWSSHCAQDLGGFAGFWYWACGYAYVNSPVVGGDGFGWWHLPVGSERWADKQLLTSRLTLF